jgi:hypothetical protein
MICIAMLSFFLSSIAIADEKKDLYDKGVAATNAGDVFAARDAFCRLWKTYSNYKDVNEQCQTYLSLVDRALNRYKVNYAEGMSALQYGDFFTAENKFRNVKRGDYAESAKEKLATIAKWKEQNVIVRSRRGQNPPSLLFGQSEIFLGLNQDGVLRQLSRAERHLKFDADKTSAIIASDKDDTPEGEIKFDRGEAIYVMQRTRPKTPEELALQLANATATIDQEPCNLRNKTGLESESKVSSLIIACGPYVVRLVTVRDSGNSGGSTELQVEIGSPDSQAAVGLRSTVLGTVFDSKGAPMPGVVVFLENRDTGFIKTATTGADGSYTISGVPPGGEYRITASKADGTQIGEPRQKVVVAEGSEREITPPLREPAPVLAHFPK